MDKLQIKTKILIMTVVLLIILGIVVTTISVSNSKDSLISCELNKLTVVKTAKKIEIENYFDQLKNLLTSLASNHGTQQAFIDFEDGFYKLSKEINLDIPTIKSKLKEKFNQNYLNQILYTIPNGKQKKEIDKYLPQNINGLIAL